LLGRSLAGSENELNQRLHHGLTAFEGNPRAESFRSHHLAKLAECLVDARGRDVFDPIERYLHVAPSRQLACHVSSDSSPKFAGEKLRAVIA